LYVEDLEVGEILSDVFEHIRLTENIIVLDGGTEIPAEASRHTRLTFIVDPTLAARLDQMVSSVGHGANLRMVSSSSSEEWQAPMLLSQTAPLADGSVQIVLQILVGLEKRRI